MFRLCDVGLTAIVSSGCCCGAFWWKRALVVLSHLGSGYQGVLLSGIPCCAGRCVVECLA